MAPEERAGATAPPTASRNPSASQRKGAAGPDLGALPRPPPPSPPRAMAGR